MKTDYLGVIGGEKCCKSDSRWIRDEKEMQESMEESSVLRNIKSESKGAHENLSTFMER